jgi:hypothetical protein
MSLTTLLLALLFSAGIAKWATTWHQCPTKFFIVSFLLSPLIGGIALLFMGDKRKVEKKTIDAEIEELVKQEFMNKYLANEKVNSKTAAKEVFDKLINGSIVDTSVIKTVMSFIK